MAVPPFFVLAIDEEIRERWSREWNLTRLLTNLHMASPPKQKHSRAKSRQLRRPRPSPRARETADSSYRSSQASQGLDFSKSFALVLILMINYLPWRIFQLSVPNRKQKVLSLANRKKHREFNEPIKSRREAREYACMQVAIGFGFTSDWMTKWRAFFKPIV